MTRSPVATMPENSTNYWSCFGGWLPEYVTLVLEVKGQASALRTRSLWMGAVPRTAWRPAGGRDGGEPSGRRGEQR